MSDDTQPSLGDVFLHFTGRELREDEKGLERDGTGQDEDESREVIP